MVVVRMVMVMVMVVMRPYAPTRTLVAEGIAKKCSSALESPPLTCLSVRKIGLHLHINKFILIGAS